MSATELTPLEELQAAHKRLSELRDRERVVPGPMIVTETEPGQQERMQIWVANVFEKLDMLHRTVGVQLSILDAAITLHDVDLDTEGLLRVEAVRLARAINGSDHA